MRLNKFFFAAVGLLLKLNNKFDVFYDELVERGKLKTENTSSSLNNLIKKVSEKRNRPEEIVRDIIQDYMESVGFATTVDLDRLKNYIERFENDFKCADSGDALINNSKS
ncbi:MAG TPA: hypothetical protein PLN69_03875 [bacterium]|nr:hypothetical protein [bacterium]